MPNPKMSSLSDGANTYDIFDKEAFHKDGSSWFESVSGVTASWTGYDSVACSAMYLIQ